jgi:hypothetical protein
MTNDAPDSMPLYPDEKAIARAVMGSRAKDWPAKAKYLEDKHGLPLVDELMGGRFWPAVVEFFKSRHGIGAGSLVPSILNGIRIVPFAPDGKENFDAAPRRRRSR